MEPGYLINRFGNLVARISFRKAKTVYETPVVDEPAVFVCNHSGVRGPVMTTLFFDRKHKTWTVSFALDKEKVANYAYHDILFGDARRCKGFWRFLSRVIGAMLPSLLRYEGVIPVYHDSNILKTFKQSVQALSEGDDLVIFAESPERYTEYINRLQPGFVDLAKLYYRRTRKKLNFYPVYLEKKNAVISVGKPILYDPEIPMEEQREQITAYLSDQIDQLARKLPPHQPRPFMPQIWYDAYGERFEHDTIGYWRMIDENR